MIDALKTIVLDFESALLNGVRSGADEAGLAKIRDEAFDRLRAVKEALRQDGQLEDLFSAALEIKTKFDMALETIKS